MTANSQPDLSFSAQLGTKQFDLTTTWGLFSPKGIDDGTELLIRHMKIAPGDDCLDLGCGYGPLGLFMASQAPEGSTHLVDKDFVAVEYAARNARQNDIANARVYLSNGFSHVLGGTQFDVIATNLPAKINGELVDIFLSDAWSHLKPGGRFYIVTISGLKEYVKRKLLDNFSDYTKLKTSGTYTAARSIKA